MRRITYSILLSLTAVAACGGDDGGGNPIDAPIDSPPPIDGPAAGCGTPETTISAYPATYNGVVLGDGNDLTVDDGACADQNGYFGASGEDHVIALTGMTPGLTYGLTLTTTEDIMMYVTGDCAAGEPAAGSCLLLVDETTGNEAGEFVAPAGGAVTLIIDTPDDVTLTTGMYTLDIVQKECDTSFDCTTAGEPVCDSGACVAGATMCTGDDAAEPDDGPAVARTLTFPTTGVPTVSTAAVCNVPALEGDWYKFTATAAGSLRIAATWANTAADLDVIIYDSTGAGVANGVSSDMTQELVVADIPAAGDYYIEIYAFAPMNTAAATPYTLTLSLPECQTSFDCLTAAEPVCATGECVAGPATCTGDDAGDTVGDDGPAAARPILVPVIGTPGTATGSVCGTPEVESDWYSVTVGAGEGITANLAWTATGTVDLDIYILDSTGRLLGTSFWLNPEVVTLTYLPAGTYYINVDRFDGTLAAAHPYTLNVTRTAAQTCTSSTDCATTYSTQFYRGNCTGGSCQFIAAGTAANGAPCDSFDDCMSGDCSYIAFESDAQKSVCTTTCTATANCAALGTNFTCTTGFQTNICVPSCATNFECGANLNSDTLEAGQPWDYLTCATPGPTTGTCGP